MTWSISLYSNNNFSIIVIDTVAFYTKLFFKSNLLMIAIFICAAVNKQENSDEKSNRSIKN